MGEHRNGKDLERLAAIEQGLNRIFKVPKGRKDRVAFIFDLVRRLYKAAPFVTERDDQIAEAVLRDLDFTRAALDLAPDHPKSMRCRISKRYAYFLRLCEFFFADPMVHAPFGRKGGQPAMNRTHPRTILRGPNGRLDPSRLKFVCLRGHISPTRGRTHKVLRPPVLVLVSHD